MNPINWNTKADSVRVLPERGCVPGMEIGGHEALWSPPEVTASWNLGDEPVFQTL